jgi:hypothetical protein
MSAQAKLALLQILGLQHCLLEEKKCKAGQSD